MKYVNIIVIEVVSPVCAWVLVLYQNSDTAKALAIPMPMARISGEPYVSAKKVESMPNRQMKAAVRTPLPGLPLWYSLSRPMKAPRTILSRILSRSGMVIFSQSG